MDDWRTRMIIACRFGNITLPCLHAHIHFLLSVASNIFCFFPEVIKDIKYLSRPWYFILHGSLLDSLILEIFKKFCVRFQHQNIIVVTETSLVGIQATVK